MTVTKPEGEDVSEPTPRPWSAPNPEWPERAMPILGNNAGVAALAWATSFERRKADAALIVEAVNAYDRLRAIEAAVGEWIRFGAGDGTDDAEAQSEQLLRLIAAAYFPSDAR